MTIYNLSMFIKTEIYNEIVEKISWAISVSAIHRQKDSRQRERNNMNSITENTQVLVSHF